MGTPTDLVVLIPRSLLVLAVPASSSRLFQHRYRSKARVQHANAAVVDQLPVRLESALSDSRDHWPALVPYGRPVSPRGRPLLLCGRPVIPADRLPVPACLLIACPAAIARLRSTHAPVLPGYQEYEIFCSLLSLL